MQSGTCAPLQLPLAGSDQTTGAGMVICRTCIVKVSGGVSSPGTERDMEISSKSILLCVFQYVQPRRISREKVSHPKAYLEYRARDSLTRLVLPLFDGNLAPSNLGVSSTVLCILTALTLLCYSSFLGQIYFLVPTTESFSVI